MLYLDHAATTHVRPEARSAMEPFYRDGFGNPSGLHGVSRQAKNAMEEARERAAELIGAERPLEIVFTGGGTEADNLAIVGATLSVEHGRNGVVTVATEHEAVLESARFVERFGVPVRVVGVDAEGLVTPSDVAAAVDETTRIVSVMSANNETGVIQPIAEIVDAMPNGILVHTDAVQAIVSEEVTAETTGADLIAIASHKFGGPKGVGLLYVRNGIDLEPVIHGGGQELGRRSGTHNVAGIVGMVAAMEATVADRSSFRSRVGEMRNAFETALMSEIPDLQINAPSDRRLVQHSHVRIPGVSSETLLIRLDQAGVAAAAGSACHSGAIDVSHVLEAMGMDEAAAAQSVRFTFGWSTTLDEALDAARIVNKVVAELR